MHQTRWPSLRLRQAALALAGLLALALLCSSGSVVMLKADATGAQGRAVASDSIALTGRLDRYEYDLEDDRTVLVTATGTGHAYLMGPDQWALTGATVNFHLPRPGISGRMAPDGPGKYSYTLTERIRLRAPLPFLETRGWRVRDVKIVVDGTDETHRLNLAANTASARNFHRKDVTGAGIGVFTAPRLFEITARTELSFRVLKADGSPAADLAAEVELPDRGYRETIRTDSEGWVRINRTDLLELRVKGGDLVEIQGPIFIELPEDESTLFWWEDPTERCEMDLRSQQERLAVEPGETAVFGFEVINRGNRPDTYRFQVDGLPPAWVEIEYGALELYPFFGQVVYVNVTPERAPETKVGTRRFTFTAKGACETLTEGSAVKVVEFHQGDLDIHGSGASPGPKLAAELRREMAFGPADREVRVIVRSGSPLPAGAAGEVERLGGKVSREFRLIHGLAAALPAGKLDALARLGWVERVDQDGEVKAMLARSVPATGAPELWALGYDGTGVKVAVVDTGVDYTHPALAGRVELGPDFANNDHDPRDGHGHGTHVAGIIASRDETRRGVAPGVTIQAIKVLSDEGSGSESGVIAGVEWAVLHGAKVINLSLGGPGSGGYDALAQAVDNAVKSGVVVAVAAGNGGPDFTTVGSPGDARLAVTVGATNSDRALMDWSSRGPTLDGRTKPDVLAPGDAIVSSIPGGWAEMTGTSMSTPHVAGVAALLVQATGAEPLLIKESLRKTALDLGHGPNKSGAGFIQPAAALEHLRQSMVMVQQEVFPGEVAYYDFTLYNLSNVDDRFRLTHWLDDNGTRYRAQSTLPPRSIRAEGGSRIPSGETAVARTQVAVPEDWAGMEDAIYLFHLEATSLASRHARDEERATLKVKATKRSMARYVGDETADLREEIRRSGADAGTRSDLLQQADGIRADLDGAVAALKARDQATANQHLQTARTRAAEMERELERRRLSQADRQRLGAHLRRIQAHLTQALAATMPE